MGNCAGIFQSCQGGDPVKKVDRDAVQRALEGRDQYTFKEDEVDMDDYAEAANLKAVKKT